MKITSYVLPIMALSTLLTACGGGGGGSGSNNAAQPAAPINSTVEVKPNNQSAGKTTSESSSTEKPAQPPVAETKPTEEVAKPPVKEAKPTEETAKPPVAESKPTEEVAKPPVKEAKPTEEAAKPPVAEAKPTEEAANPPVVESKPTDDVAPPKAPEANAAVEPPAMAEKASWSGNFAHSKDAVPVFYLVDNPKSVNEEDSNIAERKQATIQLQKGRNSDKENNYTFYLIDDNAYYGYYRDSADLKKTNINLVYSYNEAAENKGDLSQLTANYKGHFLYSTKSIPELVVRSNLELQYQNGQATGQITSRHYGDKLFDVKTTENARQLELSPTVDRLDNSADELTIGNPSHRALIDVHFVNGADGTENKSLVGKGGNDIYWGVIGAEKQ